MSLQLTSEQSAIINAASSNQRAPLIIDAKAGTGKTSTLLELLKHLHGSVSLMAFNKAIAEDIKARALATLSFPQRAELSISTVHAFGLSAFRKSGLKPETLAGKTTFMLNDRAKRWSDDDDLHRNKGTIKRLCGLAKSSGFGVESTGETFPHIENFAAWLALLEFHGLDEDITGETTSSEVCFEAQTLLKASNARTNSIDFDDMIYLPLLMNLNIPQFNHVLIDEAQDINATRRELAFRAAAERGRIIAVGDPNQAIYGFTGADFDSLDRIRKRSGADTLPLTVCWRCDAAIITAAQRLVPDIQARPNAGPGLVERIPFLGVPARPFPAQYQQLKDALATGQAMDPGAAIIALGQYERDYRAIPSLVERLQPGDVVLCRLNKPNIAVALRLLRANKRCKIEGNDVGRRLLQHGERAADNHQHQDLADTRLDVETYLEDECARLLSKNKSEMQIANLRDEVDALLMLIDNTLERTPKATWQDLKATVSTLFGDDIPASEFIVLSSIHKSKGREWPRVYLLGKPDYLPFHLARTPEQLQQEANLEYVAMTRAERELYLVHGVASALDRRAS